MPELPADFDLKLMPDWLKEPATKNPYADYQGGDDDRRSRGRGGDDWGGRGRADDRRGKPGGGQRPGAPGGRRDARAGGSPMASGQTGLRGAQMTGAASPASSGAPTDYAARIPASRAHSMGSKRPQRSLPM
jgi:hypothetical protein